MFGYERTEKYWWSFFNGALQFSLYPKDWGIEVGVEEGSRYFIVGPVYVGYME